ncbi:hypothetical protein D3C75_1041530 [compost metagenome]
MPHEFCCLFRCQETAPYIRIQHIIPFIHSQFKKRFESRYTRIIYQNINFTEFVISLSDQLLNILFLTNITRYVNRLTSSLNDFLYCQLSSFLRDISHNNRSALLCISLGYTFSNSMSRTSNDYSQSLKS